MYPHPDMHLKMHEQRLREALAQFRGVRPRPLLAFRRGRRTAVDGR